MSRLIDADLLIKALEKTKANSTHYPDKVLCDFSMEMVKNMPTAYNVEQVVEELEYEADNSYMDYKGFADKIDCGKTMAFNKAIEIVKRGGLNDI